MPRTQKRSQLGERGCESVYREVTTKAINFKFFNKNFKLRIAYRTRDIIYIRLRVLVLKQLN